LGWAGKARRRSGLVARKEEQRGQRAPARRNRVRSGLTGEVKAVVARTVRADNWLHAEASGQLPDLG
jgi:hypothetical protein